MSSNIPQPKSRLVQPGSLSSSTSSSAGLRKPASSSALRSSTTSRPTSSKAGTAVPSTPTKSRITPSATTRPTLRNATSHSSLTASTNPVPRVNSPHRPTFRSTTSNSSTASTSSTRTTRPPPLKSPSKSPAKPLPAELPEPSPTPKSLKEIIAQKRAEAKKAQQRTRPNSALAGRGSGGGDSVIADGDLLPEDNDWNGGKGALSQQEEDDLLGRRSVKESIERARETGSLNLTSRTLSYLPTSLFSIHLTVDPELLPGQTASSAEDSTPHRQLAYYEAVDLTSLKARDNSLTVLQPELSLFGSLKVLDFAKNQLSTLPDSIGELACLVHLDLSENKFEQFPENAVTYLPALSWLDISRNQLKSLKFVGGMAGATPPSPGLGSDSFFGPSSSLQRNGRGSGLSQPEVLPSLKTLNVADNQLSAASIDTSGIGGGGAGAFPPKSLVKLDLSGNPLGAASPLVAVLSSAAPSLKELSMKKCELEQGSLALPETPEPSAAAAGGRRSRSGPFANLHVLDISENGWLKEQAVKEYFKAVVERAAVIGAPNESIDVVPGAVEVRLGMRDTREKWEVEAESKSRTGNPNSNSHSNATAADSGTDGLEDAAAGLAIGERERGAPPPVMGGGRKRQDRPKSVQKEQWEADVDEGLHTEAGRLRKRLEEERKAAEAEEAKRKEKEQAAATAAATAASTSASKGEPSQAAKGTLEKYYDGSSHTLALPSSKKKPAHNRHTSLTFSRSAAAASGGGGGAGDPNVPTETLPMTVIVTQPWSSSLRALHMSNRRADSVFTMPAASADHVRLERVEEVLLDGCALGDLVRVRRLSGDAGGGAGEGTDEPIFELLGGMFPAMTTLDLSENGLTKVPGLVKLFFPAGGEEGDGRKSGLKVLRLKGNAIVDVEGLVEVAERFGRGEGEGWRGEEIDIRDNQIPKLPPVLGLLHLDVLLVEGNVFRVPPRTVWLREGTQGLLRWLRESAAQG